MRGTSSGATAALLIAALSGCQCGEKPPSTPDSGELACVPACSAEERCVDGGCYRRVCSNARCGPAEACVDDACTNVACVGVVCPTAEACAAGTCHPTLCGNDFCEP